MWVRSSPGRRVEVVSSDGTRVIMYAKLLGLGALVMY